MKGLYEGSHCRFWALMRLIALALLTAVAQSEAIAMDYPFQIVKTSTQNGHVLHGVNDGYAPVFVTVELADTTNISADRQWPVAAVIAPHSSQQLGVLSQQNPYQPSHFAYRSSFSLGDIAAIPDENAIYRLPFEEGTRFVIGQGYDQRTTHTTQETRFAVDFSIPQGTPVVAARNGVIVDLEMGHVYGGTDVQLIAKANHISVIHDDGTLGQYAHLQTNSAYVSIGQRVTAGQRLALSGNTGYSSGPHLHFAVVTNRKNGPTSLPLIFANNSPISTFLFERTGVVDVVNYTGRHASQMLRATIPLPANERLDGEPGELGDATPALERRPDERQSTSKDARESTLAALQRLLQPAAQISRGIREAMGGSTADSQASNAHMLSKPVAAGSLTLDEHAKPFAIRWLVLCSLLSLTAITVTVIQRRQWLHVLLGTASWSAMGYCLVTLLANDRQQGFNPAHHLMNFKGYADTHPWATVAFIVTNLVFLIVTSNWLQTRTGDQCHAAY